MSSSSASDSEPAPAPGPRADRYSWDVRDPQALEVTCAGIARHLARSGGKVIGLLSVTRGLGDGGRRTPGLAPVLAHLAGVLARFVDQDVAIIDNWQTWRKGGGGDGAPAPARIREVRPRVIEISPLPSADVAGAVVALQNTLRMTRKEFGAVLIDLGGYAEAGTPPSTLNLCDGVVLLVSLRRTRIAAVESLVKHLPAAKRLGAILIGSGS
jgi:hypothetical protein